MRTEPTGQLNDTFGDSHVKKCIVIMNCLLCPRSYNDTYGVAFAIVFQREVFMNIDTL